MTGHLQSSGRGGAGNIVSSSMSPKLGPKDLETPTLKTSVVTTGRGGTGNMAKNTDPAETRLRQDVEPIARRESNGAAHVGRGGTGNVFKVSSDEAKAAKLARDASAVDDDSLKKGDGELGWAEKGKNLLFGKK